MADLDVKAQLADGEFFKRVGNDIEGREFDALAVTYPLDVDNVTDPEVGNIRIFDVPVLKARLTPTAPVNGATLIEALITDAWTSAMAEINANDIIKVEAWGVWTNNDGTGRQTDIRLRIGGLAGVATGAMRIPTTVAASASTRTWHCDWTITVDGTAENVTAKSRLTLGGGGTNADVYSYTRALSPVACSFDVARDWVLTCDHDANTTPSALSIEAQGCYFEHISATP